MFYWYHYFLDLNSLCVSLQLTPTLLDFHNINFSFLLQWWYFFFNSMCPPLGSLVSSRCVFKYDFSLHIKLHKYELCLWRQPFFFSKYKQNSHCMPILNKIFCLIRFLRHYFVSTNMQLLRLSVIEHAPVGLLCSASAQVVYFHIQGRSSFSTCIRVIQEWPVTKCEFFRCGWWWKAAVSDATAINISESDWQGVDNERLCILQQQN